LCRGSLHCGPWFGALIVTFSKKPNGRSAFCAGGKGGVCNGLAGGCGLGRKGQCEGERGFLLPLQGGEGNTYGGLVV